MYIQVESPRMLSAHALFSLVRYSIFEYALKPYFQILGIFLLHKECDDVEIQTSVFQMSTPY